MLSLAFIRENPDVVRTAIAQKNVTLDLDTLLALDGETRGLKTLVDTLRAERNAISDGFKSAAQWSADGKEVFYLEGGRINIVNTDTRAVRPLNVSAEMDVDFSREKRSVPAT